MLVDPFLAGGLIVSATALAAIGWRQAFLAGDAFRTERTGHTATKRRLADVEALRKADATDGWKPTHRHISGFLYRMDEEFVTAHFDGATLQGVLTTGSGGYKAWINNRQWRAEFTELGEHEETFPDGPRCVLCERDLEPCAFCRKGQTMLEHRRPVRASARMDPADIPGYAESLAALTPEERERFLTGEWLGDEVYPDHPGPDEFPGHETEDRVSYEKEGLGGWVRSLADHWNEWPVGHSFAWGDPALALRVPFPGFARPVPSPDEVRDAFERESG